MTYEKHLNGLVTNSYHIGFDRMTSRRFSSDVSTMLTYDMDIKKIMEDQILKSMAIPKDMFKEAK
jgi:hypothetical protein